MALVSICPFARDKITAIFNVKIVHPCAGSKLIFSIVITIFDGKRGTVYLVFKRMQQLHVFSHLHSRLESEEHENEAIRQISCLYTEFETTQPLD